LDSSGQVIELKKVSGVSAKTVAHPFMTFKLCSSEKTVVGGGSEIAFDHNSKYVDLRALLA
jgi:hypothetical protein